MTGDGNIAGDVAGADGEASTLAEFLDYMRDGVIRKALDVPEDVAAQPGVPSGTSLAWLIRHLTVSEQFWLCGTTIDNWTAASTPPEGATISDLTTDYRRTTLEADTIIAEWTDLDQVVETPMNGRPPCTARWILQHMITETARHAGHADILREQIDGVVGR